jgi:sulfur carrier protein
MQLIINGETADVPELSLAELLNYLGHTDQWFAVAVDGAHIPRPSWSDTKLNNFQSIEILSPMQGG